MTSEHSLRVAAARCLALLQRYHDGEQTAATRERMTAEVEVVIGWLLELDLPPGLTQVKLLGPVEMWLLDRYGPEVGSRLTSEFLTAFERAGIPLLANDSSHLVEGWERAS